MVALRKEDIEDILPLSSTQEGMLYHYISDPNSINYHEQIRLVLKGDIKADIMQMAWDFVVESNEILRSVFRWENLERPLQIILKTYKSTISYYDFTENISDNNSVDVVLKRDFSKRIDISSENVRLYLCKLDGHFEMIISNHHILYDGWSSSIILKELTYAYTCFYNGEEPNKREKSKIKEHIKIMNKQDKGMQKDYWSDFFQGYNLMLYKKENKGIVKDFTYKISDELSLKLKVYAKERKVSYASILYSVWGILLQKYRGVDDFIFGTTVSGRGSRVVGIEENVGMFINTIPLRVTANNGDTLLNIITNVGAELAQREEYENTPLLEIKEYSQIESKDEIFDSIVVIENYPLETVLMSDCLLKIKSYSTVVRTNYDLTLGIMLFKELELNFHYYNNVYSDKIIRNMGRQFEEILKVILEDDSLIYSKLNITSEQDKNRFIHHLNKTNLEYPKNKTLTKLFSEQVSRNPEDVAIVYEDKSLTYAELDDRSNRLANILIEKEITSNAIVALLLDRSLDMIIGIIAVLKAGGAYLPIDIKYPNERIKYMLDDSNAAVVITQSDFIDNIMFNGPIINIHDEKALLNDRYIENSNSPSDLAYIIYTSGSTGKPKGALITHKNVVNLVYGLSNTIYSKYSRRLNVALMASYVFDASVQQIFTALLLGHRLHIIPTNVRLSGNELIKYLNKYSIDICDGTPVHIGILTEANFENTRINVKQFIIGGDVLLSNVVKEFYNKFPKDDFCVANIYGPTECCVDTTIYQVERNNIDQLTKVPIGKPLPNTIVYLLDKYENMVPEGGVGEICISGDGVGNGYLNSSKSTEKKFIKNPYVENQILYKTGDLGRWLPDGNIDFLGRIDNQVKIRGCRIELGEIENKILNYNKKSNFDKQIKYCKRCLLPSSYPNIQFDDEGVCNICNNYDKYKSKANNYFKYSEDFYKIINKAKKCKTSVYDCLLLYSGGKDSSYVLYRLVEMGLKVLTFTFDNGYISDTAFKNISRITSELGVDNIISKVENMDKIFLESLKEECTVCTGCFKALTAISTKIAFEKGINVIITGLSRGQIFDTKLQELYNQGIFDVDEIDNKLLLFRKMYHAVKDETTKLLNVKLDDEQAFDKTYFIDFYRYENKSSSEIINYLKNKDDFWNLPTDTGFCSTNCFINDVGIYVHIKNKKFHNYASPLAWDFRLGLATQQDIIAGLKEEFDLDSINNILQKIGYQNINIDDSIIQSVAVIDREDKSGNKYLCAFYTSNVKISNLDLKRYLSNVLPSYMIPFHFMQLDELPLTNNLKLDKRKLPVINLSETIEEYQEPKSEIEIKLVKIWCNILEIEKISCKDNFFENGGHSLKAMTLINKIRKELNKKISLEELFEAPTIKELAHLIEIKEMDYYVQIPKIEPRDCYEVSSAQKRLYVFQELNKDSTAYNIPSLFKMTGEINTQKIEIIFKELINRHDSLKTYFSVRNGEIVQLIKDKLEFELIVIETNDSIDEFSDKLITPFMLDNAPLFRAYVVETNGNSYLFLDMHHIISDGVSVTVLIKEFIELFEGKELEPLKLQYKDFAAWQNNFLKSDAIKRQERYWLNTFNGMLPVLNMPIDYDRPNIQSFEGDRYDTRIDENTTELLRSISAETGTTTNMLLLTAFYILLSKYSGQKDIVIGIPVAGRQHADLQETVGMFVNTLPLRNKPEEHKSYLEFLKEVKESSVQAIENQSYQLEFLVERLSLKRDASRNPLFDIIFNSNDVPNEEIYMKNFSMKMYPVNSRVAKVDLELAYTEKEKDIKLVFVYATILYKKSTIIDIAENFISILRKIGANRDILIGDLSCIKEDFEEDNELDKLEFIF
ncbi:non-ribosomal peptide synthetase [Lacrimispora algidixylanolytica]|uniref:Carrier domain-containing protein n=1 Tax=Lacrimispora algidixylanolytica TaxID=94868 RepID=A0A419T1Q2_9FIRM|nr:non-ribosomal peptide synthetase [Lacrimispora algidixylanolytica]RKD31341.1 hypothetical protein BET01_20705 [Lacrimispora algidixylanolytica]